MSLQGPDSSTDPPDPVRGPTDEELAAQAKEAADQALRLAKLAEESARLARELNEQVARRRGLSVPAGGTDSHHGGPSESAEPPPVVIVEREAPHVRRQRRRSRRRSSPCGRIDRALQSVESDTEVPDWIRIDVNAEETATRDDPVREIRRNWKSVVLSTAFHVGVLFLLGWLSYTIQGDPSVDTILASFTEEEAVVEEKTPVAEPIEEDGEQQEPPSPEEPPPDPPPPDNAPIDEPPAPEPMPPKKMEIAKADPPPTPRPEAAAENLAVDLAEVGSRSEAGKAILLKKYGGNAASESAVGRALGWFASVQRKDGSWNFNDVGGASHAGDVNNPMGATSYVLLAYLGAGQTHREGKYKGNVGRGLNFLTKYARRVGAGIDLRGPNVEPDHNFYVQGAAAMALCEAYEMTRDRRLRVPAQGSIDFIVAAQDPVDGGWRYEPREAGCTSVTTLQLLALFSAKRAGLNVPPSALKGVDRFYTTVQCGDGPGRYSYRAEEPSFKSASTSQAALGRMYLGAPKNDADLMAAVVIIDERGPYENRYFCYYATQVLKNWGGEEWTRWNASMRDELIRTQASEEEGPAFGSWTPRQRGPTDASGGRLFTTALSTLTLEVYYRYLPLYEDIGEVAPDATADELP